MNANCSEEQKSKTNSFGADLLLRQIKLDLMSQFMEIKSNIPNLAHKTLQLARSTSTVEDIGIK